MSEKRLSPPEKLLKKKCHCGSQLKIFTLIGVSQLPEWAALGVYMKELENDTILVMPALVGAPFLFGMAFAATCSECGNITAWKLSKNEIEYLLSEEREDGYGIAWVYNTENIVKEFANFPVEAIRNEIIKAVKLSDKRIFPPINRGE